MKRPILVAIAALLVSVQTALPMTPQERRQYRDHLMKILPDVPSFDAWVKKTDELPPDFDAFPKQNQIPDPLQFLDGHRVTTPDGWAARRDEIMRLEQQYDLGTFPPKPRLDSVVADGDDQKGNGYFVRNVKLVFGPQDKGAMRVRLTVPDGAGPFPVLIAPGIGGFGAGWAPALIRRGYMCADFAGNDTNDDAAALAPLYPNFDFATLPRRAWAVQMVIDYLATLPQVDMNHIAMTGYSRDGKMAIIAAALDTRIAAVIAGSTGVGGIFAWRDGGERNFSESIETTTRNYPSWFVPRLRFFCGREDRLPIDGNLLVALVAPRACLIEYGNNDEVSQSWGMEHSYYSAKKIYDLLGKPDSVGVMHLPGSHGADDHERDLDWLDIQFGRSPAKWVNDLQYAWDFNDWKSRNSAAVDLNTFASHATDASLTTGISTSDQWQAKADDIRKSVQWMLGDEPALMPPAARGGIGFGGRGGPGGRGALAGRGALPTLSYTPDIVNWVTQRPDGNAFGWLAPEKNAVKSRSIMFGYNVRGDLYYPANAPAGAKLPTVIWLHGFSSSLGYMWVYHNDLHPILALVKAGYAVLAFDQCGFGTRISEAGPFYDRNPQWSRMGRMVEDVRRAVDALRKDSLVDPEKIYLFGFSIGGTVALHEAALDPRVKGVVSICGFTPMRTGSTDMVSRFADEHALLPRLGLFAGREAKIPYDFDDLVGAIAPRPVLICQPLLDRDAAPAEVHAAVDRARDVFSLFNASDKLMLDEPWDYNRLPNSTQDRLIAWMSRNMK
jgi:dienelactone hydrolase